MSLLLCVGMVVSGLSPTPRMSEGLAAVLEHQTEAVPGWPWEDGQEQPASNLGGVIALSVLRAYESAPDPATWVTLVQYADHLRTYYGPSDRLPFKADIELLARLGDAGVVKDGRAFAEMLFDRVRQVSPTGQDEYLRIARGRAAVPEIVGYDVALALRAALAVGDLEYAADLADAVLANGHLELRDANDSYQVTSVGALLHALGRLARAEDVSAREGAGRALVLAQADNGSWAVNNTQATAYAVIGLSVTPTAASASVAAEKGRQWLVQNQLSNGAWAAYHDGLPEPFVGPVIPLAGAEAFAALLE